MGCGEQTICAALANRETVPLLEVKANPYQLALLPNVSFYDLDKMAKHKKASVDDNRRLAGTVAYVISKH
jgi:hypothetical protein